MPKSKPPRTNIGDSRLPQRFWDKVVQSGDCWEWTGSGVPQGYGSFWFERKLWRAHRLAYATFVGELLLDKNIDHLCSNKPCVNPAHLEQVSPADNLKRMWNRVRKPHCPKGHKFTEKTTYYNKNGHRICNVCRRKYISDWHKENMFTKKQVLELIKRLVGEEEKLLDDVANAPIHYIRNKFRQEILEKAEEELNG